MVKLRLLRPLHIKKKNLMNSLIGRMTNALFTKNIFYNAGNNVNKAQKKCN